MGWSKVVVKRALKNNQIHNPKKRLQNVEDNVQFLTDTMFSHVPSSYETLKEQYLGSFGILGLNKLIEANFMLVITFLALVNSILFMLLLSLTQ